MRQKERLIILAFVAAAVALGYWLMKKTGIVNSTSADNLAPAQSSTVALIASLADANDYGDHTAILQGFALEESSLNPLAKSKANSYGLFQIYHAANFSWLRYFGYTDADADRLYDPTFNTTMAIKIFRYFEKRGLVFPDQADIYNVGETSWAKGVRNESYRQNVIKYTTQFEALQNG